MNNDKKRDKFILDKRIYSDSVFISDLNLCQVRLMKKSTWKWLLAVPKVTDITEIFELSENERKLLTDEISQIARALKTEYKSHKINIATFGNVVAQFHVHIICRNVNDHNWPAPVWIDIPQVEYSENELSDLVSGLKNLF